MSGGLLDVSAWFSPFGFLRSEHESESEHAPAAGEIDLVTYGVLLCLDLLTLPLALLWLAGVARDGQSPE